MKSFTVVNLSEEISILIQASSPHDAVKMCFLQQTKKNYNTWTYKDILPNIRVLEGKHTVSCGDWCCLK